MGYTVANFYRRGNSTNEIPASWQHGHGRASVTEMQRQGIPRSRADDRYHYQSFFVVLGLGTDHRLATQLAVAVRHEELGPLPPVSPPHNYRGIVVLYTQRK